MLSLPLSLQDMEVHVILMPADNQAEPLTVAAVVAVLFRQILPVTEVPVRKLRQLIHVETLTRLAELWIVVAHVPHQTR